jgi:hypothetical protein
VHRWTYYGLWGVGKSVCRTIGDAFDEGFLIVWLLAFVRSNFSFTDSKEEWFCWSGILRFDQEAHMRFDQEAHTVWRFSLAIIEVFINILKKVISLIDLFLWFNWCKCYGVIFVTIVRAILNLVRVLWFTPMMLVFIYCLMHILHSFFVSILIYLICACVVPQSFYNFNGVEHHNK